MNKKTRLPTVSPAFKIEKANQSFRKQIQCLEVFFIQQSSSLLRSHHHLLKCQFEVLLVYTKAVIMHYNVTAVQPLSKQPLCIHSFTMRGEQTGEVIQAKWQPLSEKAVLAPASLFYRRIEECLILMLIPLYVFASSFSMFKILFVLEIYTGQSTRCASVAVTMVTTQETWAFFVWKAVLSGGVVTFYTGSGERRAERGAFCHIQCEKPFKHTIINTVTLKQKDVNDLSSYWLQCVSFRGETLLITSIWVSKAKGLGTKYGDELHVN